MRVSLILIHNNFDRKGSLRRCGPGKPWQRLGAGDDAVGSVREEHGGNVHLNMCVRGGNVQLVGYARW